MDNIELLNSAFSKLNDPVNLPLITAKLEAYDGFGFDCGQSASGLEAIIAGANTFEEVYETFTSEGDKILTIVFLNGTNIITNDEARALAEHYDLFYVNLDLPGNSLLKDSLSVSAAITFDDL